jgi:general secretion pathway protein F
MPVIGGIVTRLNISKFTKTLSTLLASGVPIIAALEITKNVISNRILSDVVEKAKISVQEGGTLASVLGQNPVFPPLVSHMISTGEKTGELENMLKHVANAYDAEVERKIEAMVSLIEPLMIVFLGGVVVVIVMAMLVPMFSVMGQMR